MTRLSHCYYNTQTYLTKRREMMAKKPEWLEEGEQVSGKWVVNTKLEGKMLQGDLYVTDRYLYFDTKQNLSSIAGALVSAAVIGIGVYGTNKNLLKIPFGEIQRAEIQKKLLFMNSLVVQLKSRKNLSFSFGMLSAKKALEALGTHSVSI